MTKKMKQKKQMKILQLKISFDKPKQWLNFDEFDIQIDSYLNSIEGKVYTDPLLFWKCHDKSISTTCKAR